MTFVERINKAFGAELPPLQPIVEQEYLNPTTQGDEGATEYFSGKSWKALDTPSLVYHRAALYMFTSEAHRYYLPAFMIAAIAEPEAADEIPDLIIWHFADYKKPFWSERIRVLTWEQRSLVAEFILAFANRFDPKDGYVEQALKGLELDTR